MARLPQFPNRLLTPDGSVDVTRGAIRQELTTGMSTKAQQQKGSGGPIAGGVRSDNLRPARIDPDRPLPTSRGVLSAAEIEALLRPDLPEVPRPAETQDKPVPDLETECALSRDDAERLCAALSLSLRRTASLAAAIRLEAVSAKPFRAALPDEETGAAYACFGDESGAVSAVFALSAQASAAIIEAICGAGPKLVAQARPRALTEIDTSLLEKALQPLAAHLPGASLLCLETRAAFAMALSPPGAAAALDLSVGLEASSAPAHLVVSAEALRTAAQAGPLEATSRKGEAHRPGGLTALLTARIASLSVPVSRIADLRPGDTLLLGVPADEPVQLLSGGRMGTLAAEGQMGRKGKRMAVRIARRGPALDQS